MPAWITANLANIAVAALLVAIVALAVRSMIRGRKAGKPSCGGNCASCSARAACKEYRAKRQ